MDEERRARYFTPQPDGSWLIDERLRVMVNFGCFNLADSRRFNIYSDLDIIFCRNVMLYFDTAAAVVARSRAFINNRAKAAIWCSALPNRSSPKRPLPPRALTE